MNEDQLKEKVVKLEAQQDLLFPRLEKALDQFQTRSNEQFELLRSIVRESETGRAATCPKRNDITANARGLDEVRETLEEHDKRISAVEQQPALEALNMQKNIKTQIRVALVAAILTGLLAKSQDILKWLSTFSKGG
jgi:hypothetical protein